MAVDPIARRRPYKGQGQEQEANYLIPQGSEGFDHLRDDMPDKFHAVLYNPAFNHVFIVPKSLGALISLQLPVDRSVTATWAV